MAFASLLMLLVALAVASQQGLIGLIVDGLAQLHEHPDGLVKFGLSAKDITFYGPIAIVLVSILRGLSWYGSNVTTNFASVRAANDLQNDLYSKLLELDYSRVIKEQSGAFSSRFLNDVIAIREAILKVANSFIRELLTLILVVAIMFYADWQLALLTVIILPIGYFPVDAIGKKIRKSANLYYKQAGDLSGVIEESLGGIRLVKTYSLETTEAKRVGLALETRMRLIMKIIEQRGRLLPILEIIGGAAIAGVIAFAAYRISRGESTVGNLMTFIGSLITAAASLRVFGEMNSQLQEGLAALQRFYDIFDEEPSIKNSPNAKIIESSKGEIEFRDVSFSIDETPIIENINFKAKSGRTIAFVGASGAGKSSIINLIPRLFDVNGGEIRLDGINIKELDISALRNQIALVSQDAILFETTIAQNVCLGCKTKTKDQIENALKQAACDFVFELPEGIETMVAPKGSNFSGGQRQRLAIARAILRDAPILLLDEPTSALDSENEAKIQEFLDEFCKSRTTLVVAHRLSTIAGADEINVMSNGKIIERGTHDELIANGGHYSQLAKLQSA